MATSLTKTPRTLVKRSSVSSLASVGSSITKGSVTSSTSTGKFGSGPRGKSVKEGILPNRLSSRVVTWKTSETIKEKPLERLRRIARSVQIISSVCQTVKRYAQRGAEMEWESLQTNLKLFAEFDSMLAFSINPSERIQTLPKAGTTIVRIFDKNPSTRTDKELDRLQWFLKENDTFQGYPLVSQRNLCRCMQYDRYEARRIILKRGHKAEAFYILLSGEVLVSHLDSKNRSTMKEVKEGGSFGEAALLHDTERQITVVCKTNVEVLIVPKEDFDRIIKGPQLKNRDRHLDFLRHLPLFEHFPVDCLGVDDEFACSYVRKGKLVQAPMPGIEYLIIVESGHCQLVTKVPKPKSTLRLRRCSSTEQLFPLSYFLMRCKHDNQKDKNQSSVQWETAALRDRIKSHVLLEDIGADTLLSIQRTAIRPCSSDASSNTNKIIMTPQPESASLLTAATSRTLSEHTQHPQYDKDHSKQKQPRPVTVHLVQKREFEQKPRTAKAQKPIDECAVVFLGMLNSGAVFGLEKLLDHVELDLHLISEGAECIFISSKLFLKECNGKVLRNLSDMVVSYPSQQFLQEKLVEEMEWERYKKQLSQEVIRNLSLRKSREIYRKHVC